MGLKSRISKLSSRVFRGRRKRRRKGSDKTAAAADAERRAAKEAKVAKRRPKRAGEAAKPLAGFADRALEGRPRGLRDRPRDALDRGHGRAPRRRADRQLRARRPAPRPLIPAWRALVAFGAAAVRIGAREITPARATAAVSLVAIARARRLAVHRVPRGPDRRQRLPGRRRRRRRPGGPGSVARHRQAHAYLCCRSPCSALVCWWRRCGAAGGWPGCWPSSGRSRSCSASSSTLPRGSTKAGRGPGVQRRAGAVACRLLGPARRRGGPARHRPAARLRPRSAAPRQARAHRADAFRAARQARPVAA